MIQYVGNGTRKVDTSEIRSQKKVQQNPKNLVRLNNPFDFIVQANIPKIQTNVIEMVIEIHNFST